MVKEFKDQYAIILGGSDGLGYASALKLAQHGMNLIIVYRASRMQATAIEERFESLSSYGIQFLTINADATREDKSQEIIQQINQFLGDQQIFLLLHSISKGNLKPLTGADSLGSGDFAQTIHAMGSSLAQWVQLLEKEQLWSNPARVISFTSEGSSKPMKNYAAVSAAKSVLETITRSIAVEYASQGITANCIQAGVTDTSSLRRIPGANDLMDHSIKRNPNHRLTTPQDVANAVYLLARPESQWITGNVIKVDGAESLQ